MDKLRKLTKCHGPNHPSLNLLVHMTVIFWWVRSIKIFCIIFTILTSRWIFYLSFQHHNSALVLRKTGKNFVKKQPLKAEACFLESFTSFYHHNKKLNSHVQFLMQVWSNTKIVHVLMILKHLILLCIRNGSVLTKLVPMWSRCLQTLKTYKQH